MRKSSKNPDVERFKELLNYNPETGILTWKCNRARGAMKGDVAGSKCANGYIDVKIDGEHFMAHRVAWAIMTGVWPSDEIDHRKSDRSDNRFTELREASRDQNNTNRRRTKPGLKGAYFHKRDGAWWSQIRIDGKTKHLGTFRTAEDAHAAWCKAADILHREFVCHG